MLTRKTLTELLDAFSSPDPTPGGGSASALAGALGVSLLLMVAGLPKTRHNSDADRDALAAAARELQRLRGDLTELVDRDTAAYDAVMSAYRLPKGTEEEKTTRSRAIQSALKGATESPLAIVRACREAMALADTIAAHGNPSAISDVRTGVALLSAALHGAGLNVSINLESVRDEGFVDRTSGELRRLQAGAAEAAARVDTRRT